MESIALSQRPEEAAKKIISILPNKRMKDVLEKRFGLRGPKKTLEAIGKEYGITRERVRQIEEDALQYLSRDENYKNILPLLNEVEERLRNIGEVAEEKGFITSLVDEKSYSYLSFLLTLGKSFYHVGESDYHWPRWYLSEGKLSLSEKFLTEVASILEEKKIPVSENELYKIAESASLAVFKENIANPALRSYLATSKLIRKNPFGEYGLAHWPVINPKGVRDKAYVVLAKHGSPLHFREVAEAIDKTGWSSRKAHPQTVHNELIKDKRFILVGRGLYGLAEWGYEPGTVRDVIVSVLKEAGKAIPKEEIVARVLKKRFVKENTILLNLQSKNIFKKTGEGHYTLV
jgi:hypothetical protein